MKKNRVFCFMTSLLLTLGVVSRGNNQTTEPTNNDDTISSATTDPVNEPAIKEFVKDPTVTQGYTEPVSKVVTLDNGKTIVKYRDETFVGTGVQIRTDSYMNTDKLTMDEMEIFFAKAAELGVNTVEVPVEWKDIEIDDNVWDFTYMKQLLDFVNKYNLKLELLWFGTNMCGDSHGFSIPEYILKDGKTYPKCDSSRTGEYWAYYGVLWALDFTNPNLIERESYAMQKVLKYVYEYNEDANNPYKGKYPLVAFQVLNEADIFARFRVKTRHIKNPHSHVESPDYETNDYFSSFDEAFKWVKDAYRAYGNAVKSSAYPVYTRVNLASAFKADEWNHSTGVFYNDNDAYSSKEDVKDVDTWIKEIDDIDSIDAIGDDPYYDKVFLIKGVSYKTANKLKNNYSHVAENYGRLPNTPSLILAAASQGAGYNIYDLASSPFFISHGSAEVDQGICQYFDEVVVDPETGEATRNQLLVDRPHFDTTRKVLNGLKLSGANAVEFDPDDFVAFNCFDTLNDEISQDISGVSAEYHFSTKDTALGFATCNKKVIDVYFTEKAHIKIDGVTATKIETLKFDSNGNVVTNTLDTTNTDFEAEGQVLYRITCSDVGTFVSSAWNNIR